MNSCGPWPGLPPTGVYSTRPLNSLDRAVRDALAEQVPHSPVADFGVNRSIHHAIKNDARRFVILNVLAKQTLARKQAADVSTPALTRRDVVAERITHQGRCLSAVNREIVRISVITAGDVGTRVKKRHIDRGGIGRG